MVTAMLLTKPSTISRGAPRDSKSSLTAWRQGTQRERKGNDWFHIRLITLSVDLKSKGSVQPTWQGGGEGDLSLQTLERDVVNLLG